MTRRIVLSLLALIVALLVLAVIPLGVTMTDRAGDNFDEETSARARAVASAAEETLSDHKPDDDIRAQLNSAAARGECVQVYGATGALWLSTPCAEAATDPAALAKRVLAGDQPDSVGSDSRLTVAVPVGDPGTPVGAVVLSRPTASLNDQLLAVWGWLSLCALGALAAAVFVAIRLARWVGRPLHELDAAAAKLGEGSLDVRAPAAAGPPEVRRLAGTFNSMAERMQALVHGHRAVVADVSHQLRTPLAALRLRLDLLAADADEPTAQELEGAQEEIARLSRLVDGLLAVARAENATPRQVPVQVGRVVADRVAAWEPVAAERGVSLTAFPGPRARALLGEGDLEQMLDNLLANGLDAVPPGGAISIRVTAGSDAVRVAVVDDGPGMSAKAKAAAFRRFASPGPGGSGLGLAIVHRLATANGGSVSLGDTPGGGLTAELSLLPVRRSDLR